MCNVKTGSDVKNDMDLQNLVTSVILRQKTSFNETKILTETKEHLLNSRFFPNGRKVETVIRHTMRVLDCNDVFREQDGMYCVAMNKSVI